MPVMLMEHAVDPAKVLLDRLGPLLEDFEIFNNQVLLAVYDRPKQTKSGIMLPDKYRDEEQWQGKANLVVGWGPAAFQDVDVVDEDGNVLNPGRWFKNLRRPLVRGDWVMIRPSDGFPITLVGTEAGRPLGVPCRMVNDVAIRARMPAPDVVW